MLDAVALVCFEKLISSSASALLFPAVERRHRARLAMNAKLSFLLLTPLLALGLGYGVARHATDADAPGGARLPARERLPDAGDGDDLLIGFMAEQAGRSTRYESLKATLAEVKDLKAAVVSAMLAEVEVRVLHWMRRNPVEVMGFLLNDPTCEAAGIAALLDRRVFRELATENGVLKTLGWLAKNEASFGTLAELALNEMKAGGPPRTRRGRNGSTPSSARTSSACWKAAATGALSSATARLPPSRCWLPCRRVSPAFPRTARRGCA